MTEDDGATESDGEAPDEGAFACELDEPCGFGYFGCTSHSGCEDLPYGEWSDGPMCLLEMMRDIGSLPPNTHFEYSYDRGGSPDYTSTEGTLLFSSNGTVETQQLLIDYKFEYETLYPVYQCTLREPAFFQDCLDNPSWSCAHTGSWYTDCTEVAAFECPGD